jgi:cell fate regulator YaaT (PSP1 superfamily)
MKVVSVKFKENGRAYYFDPGEFKIKEGDFVVVTTARGTECGEVVRAAHEVPGFSREVKPVIRVADAVDVRRMRQNRAQSATIPCRIPCGKPENVLRFYL